MIAYCSRFLKLNVQDLPLRDNLENLQPQKFPLVRVRCDAQCMMSLQMSIQQWAAKGSTKVTGGTVKQLMDKLVYHRTVG